MPDLSSVVSYLTRARGHSHLTYATGGGFPVWAIVLIIVAVIFLLALALARPYGRYRSRRYIDTGPSMGGYGAGAPGGRTIVEEEDVA
jgi:hypothetical protein